MPIAKNIGVFERLFLAAIGLLAGNAALLFFLLYNAWRTRSALLLDVFWLYALFSVFGWVLAGVPFALVFPARLLSRLPWPLYLPIGAGLGPLALLMTFVVMFALKGNLRTFTLAHTEGLWAFSILVSTVAFLVYAALLRKRSLRT